MFLFRKKWRGLSPPDKSGNYKNLAREMVSYQTNEDYVKKLLYLMHAMIVKNDLWSQPWDCPSGSRRPGSGLNRPS